MVDNAVVLLDAILEDRANARGEDSQLPNDQAFELFAFEQALKEQDLSVEELEAGQVGGGNDGGIDGLYCFLNGNLVEEDAEVLEDTFDPSNVKRESELDLVVVQAKQSPNFGEGAFEKLSAALNDLLDLAKTDEDLAELFSPALIERAGIFRQAWKKLATRHPRIKLQFVYATKGDTGAIHDKVKARAERLEEQVVEDIPKAESSVTFLGARELVDLAGREKSYTLQLEFGENATADNSHLALVSLNDYYKFITDDSGALRKYIFDWNVRDYEGDVEVNREIRDALADAKSPEFWWLNNGVTIVCSRASATGRTFSLDDIQIVNGLQTSVTIYHYLQNADENDPARERSILVRIIVTDEHTVRDRVIRATNRQTAVPAASLRATDEVQRDLEQYFLQQDWFYDRRKNYHRNLGRSPARIVSISHLAQAIMAIGLSEPSSARARPSSLLKRDQDYHRVFDPNLDYSIYLWVAKVQKAVDGFLRSDAAVATQSERTNMRFHVAMLVVANKVGGRAYHPSQLGVVVGTEFTDKEMKEALDAVRDALSDFANGNEQIDKIMKNREFTEALIAAQDFGSDGEGHNGKGKGGNGNELTEAGDAQSGDGLQEA
jgi:hypothetical protein